MIDELLKLSNFKKKKKLSNFREKKSIIKTFFLIFSI